jgi:hypothetical protein
MCVDLQIYSVSATTYKRAEKAHFFSDIYVRTLEVDAQGYSILMVQHLLYTGGQQHPGSALTIEQNKHGVAVGQIIGDGVVVKLRDQQGASVVNGQFQQGITFCLW